MKKIFIFSIFVLVASCLTAQTAPDTILEVVPLRETVISATRTTQSRTAVAQQVTVINRATIAQTNAQNTADLLQNSGVVFVQKSQQGGGSPVLRGFEASRVLLVVDGVRMNNAIYRAGHLQNILTTDNAALERVEILFGPASTVYGTDALGGAINLYTKNPTFAAAANGFKVDLGAFARYSTANREKTVHVDLNLGGHKIAALTSFTTSDFGDVRMGRNNGFAPFFGKRNYYVDRIEGRDSLVVNSDPYVQKYSGYRQYDLLEKIVFKPTENTSHTLNIQYSDASDIPRYDRLTDPGPGNVGLNSAEWYYGPQKRLMAAYTFRVNTLGWFNSGLRATASYQDVQEGRNSRAFRRNGLTSRIEKVKVYGLTVDAQKTWNSQSLHLGVDAQYNDVNSTATSTNVSNGTVSPASTRYPDGGSKVTNAAVYATHNWQFSNASEWSFSEGMRVGFASLTSKFMDKSFFPFPFDAISQKSPVVSGSLGVVWDGGAGWRAAVNGSTGFRMPNVDDLAKVFESAGGAQLIVPNPDIKPEKTYNLDLNVTRYINDRLRWENVLWTTAFRDAIVTDVFQFNGQSTIEYDGKPTTVVANQNKRKANLWGFSTGLDADIYENLAAYCSVAYTHGRIIEENGDSPLDHIPPVYGRIGLRYHTSHATLECFSIFNGKKALEDYNLEGEDNLQYAPPGGMPGWMTLNLRGSYSFGKYLTIQAGIENILDTQYRNFASGINAPGQNFFVTLRTNGW